MYDETLSLNTNTILLPEAQISSSVQLFFLIIVRVSHFFLHIQCIQRSDITIQMLALFLDHENGIKISFVSYLLQLFWLSP